jgi:regulator of cell morphogenesis and NO signaling
MRTVKFSDKELNTMTVSEIVSRNVKTAEIFTSNGIDFCCGGNISFKEVCKKKDLEFNQLKTRILHIDTVIDETHDYDSWGLDTLVDFTVNTHHKYVIDANSLINKYADKVSKVYGKHYDVEVTETI